MSESPVVDLQKVCQWFPKGDGVVRVLHNVSLAMGKQEVVSLVGPSGCGKSTLLYAILGTQPPKSGTVLVAGREVKTPGPDRGIVYQDYSLFPFLTALQNVALGLLLHNTSFPSRTFRPLKTWRLRREFRERAEDVLEKVGLKDHMHKLPSELSGGQRQRVAIAQAVIMNPAVLLLDEPLGALDSTTREQLQMFILEMVDLFHPSILFVTHDVEEALFLGDRVVGLSQHWKHEGDDPHPGATIVYDKVVPHSSSLEDKRQADFTELVEEIRRSVYKPPQLLPLHELGRHIQRNP
ncbi:MAG: ABC transporter ATP-binding protein [Candidatus Aenigmarchaeota archaeon]|nr:ABC transporter ATP-binding protein [Candidatus Aenigmarchaeota archaeon]